MIRAIIGITMAVTFSSNACAKTELEKFLADEVPSSARMEFLNYNGCSLDVIIKTRSKLVLEPDEITKSEIAIANECKKHVTAADSSMKRQGTDATKRAEIIRTFANLSLNERRFLYQGKQVPGFEPDEWMKKTIQCGQDDAKAISEVEECHLTKAAEIIPYTDEPAETVATAVAGVCSATYGRLVAQLAKCVGGYPQAENLADRLAKKLHKEVIAAVILERAKSRAGSAK